MGDMKPNIDKNIYALPPNWIYSAHILKLVNGARSFNTFITLRAIMKDVDDEPSS